jgi:hypothetical protein
MISECWYYREPKSCSGTIRRGKGGLNSELRAVCDGRCAEAEDYSVCP